MAEFYADKEDGLWHVFHSETGKSHASYCDEGEARRDADARNDMLAEQAFERRAAFGEGVDVVNI